MKLKIIFIIFSTIFISCSQNKTEKVIISDKLKNKLLRIISEYEEFSTKNDRYLNPSVYEVYFEEINDSCLLTIATSYYYKNNLDAVLTIDGNLVAFYNLQSKCNTLVNARTELDTTILKEYINEEIAFDNYSPTIWNFKIHGDSLILLYQNKFHINFNKPIE